MITSKNGKRKPAQVNSATGLPKGVKLASPPRSAARRELLSGPDITTSGGCRTVHGQPIHR